MALTHLVLGMGFGLLCAAACLAAGLGGTVSVLAYAVGGAVNVLLLAVQTMEPAERI